jgi:dolichol-phosphate mannosyltransferase
MDKLSLVIPTYNEAGVIGELCRRLICILNGQSVDFEIIIVDDNSPDKTWEIVEGLSRHDARIILSRRQNARGLSGAVINGWLKATGNILGVIDADMQHPPEILPDMIENIIGRQRADIVIARRNYCAGSFYDLNLYRRIISYSAVLLSRVFIPNIVRGIRDPLSGFFILRKEVIAPSVLEPLGYKILLEVLAKGKYGCIREIPYCFVGRKKGKSKACAKQYLLYIRHLIKLRHACARIKTEFTGNRHKLRRQKT